MPCWGFLDIITSPVAPTAAHKTRRIERFINFCIDSAVRADGEVARSARSARCAICNDRSVDGSVTLKVDVAGGVNTPVYCGAAGEVDVAIHGQNDGLTLRPERRVNGNVGCRSRGAVEYINRFWSRVGAGQF